MSHWMLDNEIKTSFVSSVASCRFKFSLAIVRDNAPRPTCFSFIHEHLPFSRFFCTFCGCNSLCIIRCIKNFAVDDLEGRQSQLMLKTKSAFEVEIWEGVLLIAWWRITERLCFNPFVPFTSKTFIRKDMANTHFSESSNLSSVTVLARFL